MYRLPKLPGRTRTLLLAACVAGVVAAPGVGAAEAGRVHFWLTILHNNDGESDLIQLDPGDLTDFGGVARFKRVVDDLRRQAVEGPHSDAAAQAKRGVIVVSSGDNFLPGPEFNASLDKGVPFFDTIAMDLIGYDAVAIGNHDFDFGPDVLADFIEGYAETRPVYLSANLDYTSEPRLRALFERGRIARSVVVEQHGESIGIIGAITPNLSFISSPRRVSVSADVAGAVGAEVRRLEAQGINKIVLISHLQEIEADLALALSLRGIDVMVAGGGDEVLANEGDRLVPGDERFGPYPVIARDADGIEIPVITTGGSYGYVGRLVVGFDAGGAVVAIGAESGPVRVAGGSEPDAAAPDAQMQTRVIEPVIDFVDALAAEVVARSDVELDGRKARVRSGETNQGDLMADAMLWQARRSAAAFGLRRADVALQNGGGIRNDSVLAAGAITTLDTFNMAPFPNYVAVFSQVSRERFKEVLENALSRTLAGDPAGGSGRFPHVSGFRLRWAPAGTARAVDEQGNVTTPGNRVRDVILDDGTAIVTDGAVVAGPGLSVATADFLARGGDQYPFGDADFRIVGVTYQQALRSYLLSALQGRITAARYPPGGDGRVKAIP